MIWALLISLLFNIKNPAILYLKSQIALDNYDLSEGAYYLEEALISDPNSQYLRLSLAKLYFELNLYEEAYELLKMETFSKNYENEVEPLIFYFEMEKRNLKEGIKILEKLKGKNLKRDGLYYIYRGILDNIPKIEPLAKEEDFEKFSQYYQHFFPQDMPFYYHLADYYLYNNDIDKFNLILRKIPEIKKNPHFLDAYFAYLEEIGSCDKIIELKEDILNIKDPQHLFSLLNCYFLQKNHKEIENTLGVIINNGSENIDFLDLLFIYKIVNGKFEEARNILSKYPKDLEENVNLKYLREALLFQMEGNFKGAEEILIKLLNKIESKESLKVLWKLYFLSKDMGRCERALNYAYKIYEEDKNYDNLYTIAEAHLLSRDIKNALFIINSYNELTNYQKINYMIDLLVYYDYLEEAEILIKEAKEREIFGEDIDHSIAYYYYKKGKIEEMEKIFKRYLDNPNFLNSYGYFLIENNLRIDEAMEYINKALQREPENGNYMDSLGWGYYKKGEYEKAYEWINKDLYYVDFNGTIFMHLGDVCIKLGKFEEAWTRYNQALFFQNPETKDLINKIEVLIKKYGYKK